MALRDANKIIIDDAGFEEGDVLTIAGQNECGNIILKSQDPAAGSCPPAGCTIEDATINDATLNNTTLTGNTTIGACSPETTTIIRGDVDFQCWDIDFTGTNVTGLTSWYTLPAATVSTLWGIKVGSWLSILPDGTLSATWGSGYTDEQAQDAVGTILVDTSTINLTYTDATPSITADVNISNLISTDAGNDLVAWTDGKLFVNDTTWGSGIPDLSWGGTFVAWSWASPFTFTAVSDGWLRLIWLNSTGVSYGVLYEDDWSQLIPVLSASASSNGSWFSWPYAFVNDAPSAIIPIKAWKDYYYRNFAWVINWAYTY